MPKRNHQKRNQQRRRTRRLSIRSERHPRPDTKKIAGAVIALAMAQAEKEAQEQRSKQETTDA